MVFLRPLIRYADFRGRARRSEYWGFWLFQALTGGFCAFMAIASIGNRNQIEAGNGFLTWMGVAVLLVLAFLIPHQAVTFRRLHDTDRSAWWLMLQAPGVAALFMFINAIAAIGVTGGAPSPEQASAILAAAGGGLLLLVVAGLCNLALFVIMLLPGTAGENRFGPDPRGPGGRNSSSGPAYGGIAEDRLDELFAQARRDGGEPAPQGEARWKPDLDFGPMNGRPVEPAPSPVARQAATAWPEAPSGPTFGRRNA